MSFTDYIKAYPTDSTGERRPWVYPSNPSDNSTILPSGKNLDHWCWSSNTRPFDPTGVQLHQQRWNNMKPGGYSSREEAFNDTAIHNCYKFNSGYMQWLHIGEGVVVGTKHYLDAFTPNTGQWVNASFCDRNAVTHNFTLESDPIVEGDWAITRVVDPENFPDTIASYPVWVDTSSPAWDTNKKYAGVACMSGGSIVKFHFSGDLRSVAVYTNRIFSNGIDKDTPVWINIWGGDSGNALFVYSPSLGWVPISKLSGGAYMTQSRLDLIRSRWSDVSSIRFTDDDETSKISTYHVSDEYSQRVISGDTITIPLNEFCTSTFIRAESSYNEGNSVEQSSTFENSNIEPPVFIENLKLRQTAWQNSRDYDLSNGSPLFKAYAGSFITVGYDFESDVFTNSAINWQYSTQDQLDNYIPFPDEIEQTPFTAQIPIQAIGGNIKFSVALSNPGGVVQQELIIPCVEYVEPEYDSITINPDPAIAGSPVTCSVNITRTGNPAISSDNFRWSFIAGSEIQSDELNRIINVPSDLIGSNTILVSARGPLQLPDIPFTEFDSVASPSNLTLTSVDISGTSGSASPVVLGDFAFANVSGYTLSNSDGISFEYSWYREIPTLTGITMNIND